MSKLKYLMRSMLFVAAAAIGVATAASQASAQSVDDIVSRGTLRVGLVVDSPPFGILNAQNEPDGYDADVAKSMAAALGVTLEIVPVAGSNRIPYLLSDQVDVIIGVLGITAERAKQVMFSMPYSAIDIVLLGQKAVKIESYEDLAGLAVSVPRGSSPDLVLTKLAPPSIQLQRYDDDSTAIQALLSGQSVALGTNNLIAARIVAQNPNVELERKLTMTHQYQGIAVRRGAHDLHQWINTYLYTVKNSGELSDINQKWLGEPLGVLPTF